MPNNGRFWLNGEELTGEEIDLGRPTPLLDVFLQRYDRDDNEWWRLDAGDQLNLFNKAVERMRDRSPAPHSSRGASLGGEFVQGIVNGIKALVRGLRA